MDLRAYYGKLKEVESTLEGECIVLVSLKTPEGGKPGVITEATRRVAAKMIAEGRAAVASEEQASAFRTENREAKARYEEEQAARRLQVMVIPSQDLRKQKDRS